MTIVTGDKADEFDFAEFVPGQSAADAELHCLLDEIVHNIQARSVRDKHHFFVDVKKRGKQFFHFGNAVKTAVISDVHAVFRDKRRVCVYHIEHNVCKVKLRRAGFAP